jgi:8-oxo-dGTP diphosphatase
MIIISKHIDELPDGEELSYAMTLVIDGDDNLLLVKRTKNDESNPGYWEVPGGHIDEGENALEAATRELKEEANIDIDGFLSNHTFFEAKNGKYGVLFKAVALNPEEVELNPEEHDGFAWIEEEDLNFYQPLHDDFVQEVRSLMASKPELSWGVIVKSSAHETVTDSLRKAGYRVSSTGKGSLLVSGPESKEDITSVLRISSDKIQIRGLGPINKKRESIMTAKRRKNESFVEQDAYGMNIRQAKREYDHGYDEPKQKPKDVIEETQAIFESTEAPHWEAAWKLQTLKKPDYDAVMAEYDGKDEEQGPTPMDMVVRPNNKNHATHDVYDLISEVVYDSGMSDETEVSKDEDDVVVETSKKEAKRLARRLKPLGFRLRKTKTSGKYIVSNFSMDVSIPDQQSPAEMIEENTSADVEMTNEGVNITTKDIGEAEEALGDISDMVQDKSISIQSCKVTTRGKRASIANKKIAKHIKNIQACCGGCGSEMDDMTEGMDMEPVEDMMELPVSLGDQPMIILVLDAQDAGVLARKADLPDPEHKCAHCHGDIPWSANEEHYMWCDNCEDYVHDECLGKGCLNEHKVNEWYGE